MADRVLWRLMFERDLILAPTATTVMELGGIDSASYDQIFIGKDVIFDGILEIGFLDGFVPAAGEQFQLFSFSSSSGTFSDLVFRRDGYEGYFNHDTGWLEITAIPEPRVIALLMGLVALGGALLRRRRSFF